MSGTRSSRTTSGDRSVILVVGASGFLGQSVVRAFTEAGYTVRGLVRETSRARLVEQWGGKPVYGNILHPPTLRTALAGVSGAIHLAANPSVGEDPGRVRIEGSRNLLDAARVQGVGRVLIGSGYWVYRGRPAVLDEEAPVSPLGESRVNFDAERTGLESDTPGGPEVLVVRPGMVYGNGSWFRGMAEAIRTGEYRVAGSGENRWSFVDRWDAGAAFRTIWKSGAAGGIYNVVDGHPAPLREFADFVAARLHVPSPPSITMEEAAGHFGEIVASHLAADRAASNQKLRRLGWEPRTSSYRDGIPPLLDEMFPP